MIKVKSFFKLNQNTMNSAWLDAATYGWDQVNSEYREIPKRSNLSNVRAHNHTLFRTKRFEINFFVRQNASKFAIFIEKENPRSFFRFSFSAFLNFTL